LNKVLSFHIKQQHPNGGTTIAFKKASLKLEVTPQITPEGGIILDVEVNKDSPGEILLGARGHKYEACSNSGTNRKWGHGCDWWHI
jgi:type II secretory pathway component GspD/PulD (secretin)